MDSKFIQESVQKWLYERDHIYQACNFNGCGYAEADIIAITRSSVVTEVEVKISLSDYKADFKKTHKHYKMQNCGGSDVNFKVPNRFYYACPKGMIKDVPEYAGLIYIDVDGSIEWVKQAPMLHKRKPEEKLMIRLLENLTAKIIFGCQYMTYQNRLAKAELEKREADKTNQYQRFMEHARNLKLNKGD